MRILLDTNIIIRAAQPNQPTWPDINQALTAQVAHGCTLCVVPQNIYEFWVVATRRLAQNGFGLTPADAKSLVDATHGRLTVLRDEGGIFELWVATSLRNAQRLCRREFAWQTSVANFSIGDVFQVLKLVVAENNRTQEYEQRSLIPTVRSRSS